MLVNQKKTLVLSIFCDYQSTTAQTVADLVCSLVKQLIQDNGLSIPIRSLYGRCLRDQTRPSLNDLTEILSQEFKLFQRVYIVLDALDEFIDDNGGREELIDVIKSLGDNIHLLVTSRDITTIGSLFEEDTRLDIRATDEDINAYITNKLSRGRLARHIKGRDDLREVILTGVAEKAKGMWVARATMSVAPTDRLSVGSFWQACTWTCLLRQRIQKYFVKHSVNCQKL